MADKKFLDYEGLTHFKGKVQDEIDAKQDTATLEADVSAKGFTKNEGTITEVKMNGVSVGTAGSVDLGTVITDVSDKENKADLDTDVAALGYIKGTSTITEIRMNGSAVPITAGSADLGTVITAHQDISGKENKADLDTDVSALGYTKNEGTVTGVKVNGTVIGPSSGTVDIGTVITDVSGKADVSALNTEITDRTNADTALQNNIDAHAAAINPHGITKAVIGLGNVDNTADADKPVSTAMQTAIDGKVTKNADIIADTKCKVTYDEKGLVTAGADLTESDIPAISTSKVTGLDTALAGKLTGVKVNGAVVTVTGGVADVGTVITDVSGKLDVLGNEVGSGEPYKLPYFFSKTADASKIEVTAHTITMDNAKSLGTYKMEIPSATTATAGLMASADKSALDAIQIKDASVASGTLTISKRDGTSVTFTKTSVADSLVSTSVTEALSANKGKELNDRINDISSMGRFLSVWNCATGVPIDKPGTIPYTYKSGDYYIVGSISTGVNYRPKGAQFTDVVSQDSEVEPDSVHVNDIYRYTTSGWVLQSQDEKIVTFSSVTGNPRDNTLLATELDKAVPKLGTEPGSGEQYHFPYNINGIVQNADTISTSFDTVTLDGNKTKVSYNLAIPSADVANNKAGLYSKALADVKADVSALNTEITERTAAVTNEATARADADALLQTAINTKLDKPTTITAGTHTKITYDANGLITAGADLVEGDIPALATSKITGLDTALASKQNASTLEADVTAKGFTKNLGTITGIKMNGASVGTSGEVDLGTVITAHQDISGKLDRNAAITGATKCKITYDANGLVTAGVDLTETDIPALQISKITDLQTALDGKITANAAITGATKCKITFDSKGLVTAGTELTAADIPTIEQSQVNGLGTALSDKQNASTLETDVAAKGFTKNEGTITGITMNGSSMGTSGVVDLGTVITAHQSLTDYVKHSEIIPMTDTEIDALVAGW